MSEKTSMSYPEMLVKFRKRRDELEMMIPLISEMGQTIEAFKTAESCLSFGPGYGEYDLEFMKRCLPNLKTIVAVDKKPSCAEELKINIDKVFNGKVNFKVFVEDAETWNSTDVKFDVVLTFHVLYCIHPRLQPFFKNVFENLLKPKGLIVMLNEYKISSVLDIFCYLNDVQVDADTVKAELAKVGGKVVWSKKFSSSIDLQKYDDDLLNFFNSTLQNPVDPNTLKSAIETVVPDGKGSTIAEFIVAEKDVDSRLL